MQTCVLQFWVIFLHNNYSTLFETNQNPLGKYSAWSLFDGLINLSIFGRKSNSSGITYNGSPNTFPFHQMKEETFRKCGLFLSSNISRNGRKGIYMNMIKNIFKKHFYLEMWNRIYVWIAQPKYELSFVSAMPALTHKILGI